MPDVAHARYQIADFSCILDITPVHGSFLETNPEDAQFANVEYLLLDPSCSGSGIISRLDHLVDDEDEKESK